MFITDQKTKKKYDIGVPHNVHIKFRENRSTALEVEIGDAHPDRHTFTGMNAPTHTHSQTVNGDRISHPFFHFYGL